MGHFSFIHFEIIKTKKDLLKKRPAKKDPLLKTPIVEGLLYSQVVTQYLGPKALWVCCFYISGKRLFGHSFSIPQWKPKTRFSCMFGNNHAPKKYQHYLQVIFELQGPSTGWFGQNLWITGISKFFVWLNEVPRKFLSLKNMWNLATFLLLANLLSGTISRGPLTRRKCYFH